MKQTFVKYSMFVYFALLFFIGNAYAQRTPAGQIISNRALFEWTWDFTTILDSTAFTDTTFLIVQELRDIVVSVEARNRYALPGEEAIFDISVLNYGNVPLLNLTINESVTLTEGYTPLDTIITPFDANEEFTWTASMPIPYLAPGTVIYDSVSVHARRVSTIWDYDSIIIDDWDYLTFKKFSSHDTIVTNSSIEYFLIAQNVGYIASGEVVIIDSMHHGFVLREFSEPSYFTLQSYDANSNVAVWRASGLDVDVADTIRYTGSYPPAMCDSVAINKATLEFRDIIIEAFDTVWVDCRPVISCSIWVDKDSAGPYDTLNYGIIVESQSNFTISRLNVLSIIPEYTENPRGEFDNISYETDKTTLRWNIENLEPNQRVRFNYSVTVSDKMTEGSYDLIDSLKIYYPRDGRYYLLCSDYTVTGLIMNFLFLSKRCMSREAYTGDVLLYILNVHNKSEISDLSDVIVEDEFPFGFRYMKNSAKRLRDAGKFNIEVDDTSSSRRLRFHLGHVPANTEHRIVYQMVVGSGGAKGDGVNRAKAFGYDNSARLIYSNEAAAKVELKGSHFANQEFIIGKVFMDDDGDGIQTSGERGIPDVTLYTETGIRIVTDENGKFSIPYIEPGMHVIRIDHETLPERSRPIVTTTQHALDPYSQFVNVPVSGFARATFAIQRGTSIGDKIPYHRAGVNIRLTAEPETAVFVDSENQSGKYVLKTVYFDKGIYSLNQESMGILDELLATIRQFVGVKLEVQGYADRTPVRPTAEYRDNFELSQLRSSTVMSYLQQRGLPEHMLRFVGFGEQKSRGADVQEDRKVEIVAILDDGLKPAPPLEDISFVTHFDVKANEPISELSTRYQFIGMDYIRGSANFSGVPMDDRNARLSEVAWIFTDLPAGMSRKISFDANLYEVGYYEIAPRLLLTGDIRFVSGENIRYDLSVPIMPQYRDTDNRLRIEQDRFPPSTYYGFLSSSFAEPIEPSETIPKDGAILYRVRAAFPSSDRLSEVILEDKLDRKLIYIENSAFRDNRQIHPQITPDGLLWSFELLPGQSIIEFEYLVHTKEDFIVPEKHEIPVRFR